MDLQAVAATGWGFEEQAFIGDWPLRAAGGQTSRANCAWPLGDSGMPLRETLDAVRDWYGARGLEPRVQTIDGSELDREVVAYGFVHADRPALRQVAPIGHAVAWLGAGGHAQHRAEVSAELPADYFEVYRRGLGRPQYTSILTSGGALIRFGALRDGEGRLLSVGRLALDTSTGYAGLAAVATAEPERRRGLSTVVLRELLEFARKQGATHSYLEVEEDNAPALAFYRKLGYRTVHRYQSRTPVES